MSKILEAIAKKEGLPSKIAARRWLKQKGLNSHRAGGDKIQLITKDVHKVQHTDGSH